MRPMSAADAKTAGFTLVELLTSTILTALIVTLFVSSLLLMLRTATAQKTQLELGGENQIALDIMERDVRLALKFGTTVPTTAPTSFQDSYGPQLINEGWTGSWTYKGNTPSDPMSPNKALILRQMATTAHPLAASRQPVYIKSSVTNPYVSATDFNCTAFATSPTGSLTQNYKLPYYYVYFVRDHTLYRRTLTDSTTQTCAGFSQYQKQSCPGEDTTRPAVCRANDEIIARNVAGFWVTYQQETTTPSVVFTDLNAYTSSDPSILDEADSVLITLTLQKTVGGQTLKSTLSVRVSRINT